MASNDLSRAQTDIGKRFRFFFSSAKKAKVKDFPVMTSLSVNKWYLIKDGTLSSFYFIQYWSVCQLFLNDMILSC